MNRPQEYETLISKGFFREKPINPRAAGAFFKNAQAYLAAAELLISAGLLLPAFAAAYDSLSQLFQSMLEHHNVRVRTSWRNRASNVVCRE